MRETKNYRIPMKKFFPIVLISVFILSLIGCGDKSSEGTTTILDVESAIDKPKALDLPEIAKSIDFIPLDESVPVGEIFIIGGLKPATEDGFYIISADNMSPVLHFDRTGKFISTVGRIGRGPDELFAIAGITTNEETSDVYLDSGIQIVGFNAAGRVFTRDDSLMTMGGMTWYDGRLMVPTTPSIFDENAYIGDSVPFIDLFDRELKPAGSIHGPNLGQFLGFAKTNPRFIQDAPFISFNGSDLIVRQGRGDTLYHYISGILSPAYIMNSGRYAPPAEVFGPNAPMEWNDRNFTVLGALEGDRYIILTATNLTNEEILRPRQLVFDRENPFDGFSATGGAEGKPGLYIDGIAFTPMYIRNNSLVGYMKAFDIVDNAATITNPHLKDIAANLKEDNNPVMVVVELKK